MRLIAANQQAELSEDNFGRDTEEIVFEEEENGIMMGEANDKLFLTGIIRIALHI